MEPTNFFIFYFWWGGLGGYFWSTLMGPQVGATPCTINLHIGRTCLLVIMVNLWNDAPFACSPICLLRIEGLKKVSTLHKFSCTTVKWTFGPLLNKVFALQSKRRGAGPLCLQGCHFSKALH